MNHILVISGFGSILQTFSHAAVQNLNKTFVKFFCSKGEGGVGKRREWKRGKGGEHV